MKNLSCRSIHGKFALCLAVLTALVSACGGGGSSSGSSSSSTSSIASSHVFSATPVTPALSGIWPDVKVSASGTKTLKFDWTAPANATHYKLMKKADASATYQQVGVDFTSNTIVDAVSVHLTDWVNMRYKVQACDAANNCTDSTEVVANSAMLTAITYVKASNTDANDWFGWSLAISADGSTMAIGAPGESSHAEGVNGDQASNDSPGSGAVYVFVKSQGNWVQQAYIKASNTEQAGTDTMIQNPIDRFGYHVALSADGNSLAISAINEDSPSIGVNCFQTDYIVTPATSTSSSSTKSTSASSVDYRSYHYPLNIGAVYVFNRSGETWTQEAYIKPIYHPTSKDFQFGSTLAFSGDGNTLAVGSIKEASIVTEAIHTPRNSSASSSSAGCIDFTQTSSSTSSSSNSNSSSSSSSSSSASSNSSSSVDIFGGEGSGAVYVYVRTTNGWESDAFIKASDAHNAGEFNSGSTFGVSIGLSNDGTLMAVGATGAYYTTASSQSSSASSSSVTFNVDSGAVYIFVKDSSNNWVEKTKLYAQIPHSLAHFGYSIALSPDATKLAVGAPSDKIKTPGVNPDQTVTETNVDANIGAAYVFTRSGETWVQQAYLKPNVPKANNFFGYSLSMTADGKMLVVGAPFDLSQATGINGDQEDTAVTDAGAAYLFSYVNGNWAQKSYIKAPVSHSFGRFGRAACLTTDGSSLFISVYREPSSAQGVNGDRTNTSATAAGAVFIY